ncbi:MAG: asparagine synthase (glutamine-hydrolyzing), partial [Terrabacter sp.]
MCGIAGYFGLDSDAALLERMALEQQHRGPDDARIFVDSPVGLAHQRLVILDRAGGAQPMTSTDGRYVLIYNGEVYNYRELRAELEGLSRTFTTQGDTEVVLQAFAQWGSAAFERFNGMFALAVWDRHARHLTLARDPFGIKPLHLCRVPTGQGAEAAHAGGAWLFSSEIKPILASGLIEARPNDRTVYRYLRYRVHDDGPETFFDGIERVMPGEVVTLSTDGIRREMFSRMHADLLDAASPREGYDAGVAEEFRQRLTTAVALRLRSDVPVGTSLSGGLDSSAITVAIDHLLAKGGPVAAVGTRQRTFSAVFPGYRNDEERYVDAAVGSCTHGVRSHKTRPTSAEFLQDVTDFVRAQEEPVISTGPYAQYRVMKDASQYVTVMLDGQGADELLAGYVPQLVVHLRDLLSRDRRSAFRELVASRDVLAHLAAARTRTLLPHRNTTPDLLRPEFRAAHATEAYA